MKSNSSLNRTSDYPQPPALYSFDAEQALLGCLLINPDAYHEVSAVCKAEYFYLHHHQWIWNAVAALALAGEAIDIITIGNQLTAMGQFEEAGGTAYLAQLISATATSLHVVAYAQTVRGYALRRHLVVKATEVAKLALDTTMDIEAVVNSARAEIMRDTDLAGDRQPELYGAIAATALEVVEQRVASGTGIVGVATGLTDLDEVLGGLDDVTLIAGRPGEGKTAFMGTLAKNIAYSLKPLNEYVYWAILEMSDVQLALRLLATRSGIDADRLRRGLLKDGELPRLRLAVDAASEWPIIIDDVSSLTPAGLVSRVALAEAMYGRIGVILVDYLQLMQADAGPGGRPLPNRTQEISQITRGLALLSKMLRIPVIAGSQLNRAVEGRVDRRPQLSDLRDSGTLEQDAATVLFISRDRDTPGLATLIIGKHRHGRGVGGDVSLTFLGSRQEFVNYTGDDISAEPL